MKRRTRSTLREINEINLTPLMDLTFILLITFIITFPLIEQGIPVNLPKGKADDMDARDSRTITLNLEGDLYLDERVVSLEELTSEMDTLGRAAPDTTVMVRADEGVVYGKLAEVLRILHGARITRMALITQATDQP